MQSTAALSAQNYRRTALPHSCICAFYCMHSMEIRACTQESQNVKTRFRQWFGSGSAVIQQRYKKGPCAAKRAEPFLAVHHARICNTYM